MSLVRALCDEIRTCPTTRVVHYCPSDTRHKTQKVHEETDMSCRLACITCDCCTCSCCTALLDSSGFIQPVLKCGPLTRALLGALPQGVHREQRGRGAAGPNGGAGGARH